MALLIFFFSLSLLHLVLEESIHAFNSKFPIPMEFSFAYGPLAFLHVITLKRPKMGLKPVQYLHFLPSLLLDVVLFVSFFLYVRTHQEWAYANIANIQGFALVIISLCVLQLGIYTFLIYTEAKAIKRVSRESGILYKWCKTIMTAWFVIMGFLTIAVPIAAVNLEILDENSYWLYKPLGTIIGLCIYGLGYLYLLKYMDPLNAYLYRVRKIRFSEDEIQRKKRDLLVLLERDEPYKDSSISVAKLAVLMKWPINDLSFIINSALSTTFNDLINQYRVRAFKDLVSKPENGKYSLLGLAQEVGFSSKASFYRAFKKEMGTTPSQYLKSSTLN